MRNSYNPVTETGGNSAVSLNSCGKLLAELDNIKQALVREFGTSLNEHHRLLESALNEAEALAWQTPYPHLLFPVLAHEKAMTMRKWAVRQRLLKQTRRLPLAA